MHERERHRIIMGAVAGRPVATVAELSQLTSASEATIRRDIAELALQKKLRRVRGGAEPLNPSPYGAIMGRSLRTAEGLNQPQKRAIAAAAADLCQDGDAVILNGGSTIFQMVHFLAHRQLQVMTNSFGIAEHLVKHSKCTVILPAGAIYREQNLILSAFENDGIPHFAARRMFMGAQAVSSLGIAESEPLIVQSEQRLMRQAEELVLLVDSSKFSARSAMIVAPLDRVSVIVTDEDLPDAAAQMIEAAGVRLIVADTASLGMRQAAGAA